jgi:hypothetical protein
MRSDNPNTTATDAAVNVPAQVTLYDQSGRSVSINEADRDHFLSLGFRVSKFDIEDAASELKALFAAALDAVTDYIDGVTSDGVIDTSDTAAAATAERAMREVEVAWFNIQNAIHAGYPVAQAEPTTLVQQVALVNGNEISLLDLEARRILNPNDTSLTNPKIETRERQIDPGQVKVYLSQPGWSKSK